jgi:hypothetical protein
LGVLRSTVPSDVPGQIACAGGIIRGEMCTCCAAGGGQPMPSRGRGLLCPVRLALVLCSTDHPCTTT